MDEIDFFNKMWGRTLSLIQIKSNHNRTTPNKQQANIKENSIQ